MTVGWVTDDARHAQWLLPSGSKSVISIESASVPCCDTVIVLAEAGVPKASFLGVRWYERLRKVQRSCIPVILYGMEEAGHLRSEFRILSPEVPGAAYLQLPFSPAELRDSLERVRPLSQTELQRVIRWYSELQDEWRRMAHAFGNSLRDWPAQMQASATLLDAWARSVRECAPDQVGNVARLESALEGPVEGVRRAAQALEDGLSGKQLAADEALPEAPTDRPPLGFHSIAIADDEGYVPSAIEALRRFGYEVAGPALNRAEASSLIEFWHPQIVIADMHLPSSADGLAVMATALASPDVQMVIAISRARIQTRLLPAGVEDCSGGLDFQDGCRIHRLIWMRAQAQGVSEHV